MTQQNNNDSDEPLIQHLEALRTMLINSILAVLVLSPLGFWIAPKCIDFLIRNSLPQNIAKLHYFSPMEVFMVQLKTGIILAFIFAFPFIVSEIRRFVLPALYQNERKFLSILVCSATFLFSLGSLMCIFCILPLIMKFSATFSSGQLEATLGLANFINISAGLILAFGLMFQFPLIILLAVKFGLVKTQTLKDKRPYVIVLILILAAIFTPPDVVSQLMLGIPTWILFEIGLLIAQKLENTKES